jgi:3-hydroxyacyl-CoA dehydrogenase/enoyl-CoA hydratase/3-hydroxybutyryl-CoA epimerase
MLLKGDPAQAERRRSRISCIELAPKAEVCREGQGLDQGGGKGVAPWDEKGFKLPSGKVFSPGRHDDLARRQRDLRRETYDNYPAAKAILQCVYEGLQLPMDRALRVESRYFAKILRSKEAAAMIRSLFVSMQELNKGARRPANVPKTNIKKVGVIGAGFMGAGIAYVTAVAGIEVVLIDRDQAAADKGKAYVGQARHPADRQGPRDRRRGDALLARITRPPITPRSRIAISSSRPCSRIAR